jgi:hypothetical protein
MCTSWLCGWFNVFICTSLILFHFFLHSFSTPIFFFSPSTLPPPYEPHLTVLFFINTRQEVCSSRHCAESSTTTSPFNMLHRRPDSLTARVAAYGRLYCTWEARRRQQPRATHSSAGGGGGNGWLWSKGWWWVYVVVVWRGGMNCTWAAAGEERLWGWGKCR